jgi:DNA mismatch endonuclease (patch repair protein)
VDRSENMRRIRSKDSYRFRLHRHDLPGRPDMVFPARRKVIFVHGCFWHYHEGCKVAHLPKSNNHYWTPKLLKNSERDAIHRKTIRKLGWQYLVLWECETSNYKKVAQRVKKFLG